jgi:hypothetical protein
MAQTVHVIPAGKGWRVVKRDGKTGAFFPKQRDAVADAITTAKHSHAAQVVVHGRNGQIRSKASHGLPRVQKPPQKSGLGTRNIQRAVSKVVLDHLIPGNA